MRVNRNCKASYLTS